MFLKSRFCVFCATLIFTIFNTVQCEVNAIQGKEQGFECYSPKVAQQYSDFYVQVKFLPPSGVEVPSLCQYQVSNSRILCEDSIKERAAFSSTGTFVISNVQLEDEGTYTCVHHAFSLTDEEVVTKLNVYVAPSISVQKIVSPLRADSGFVEAAWCTASGGKPEASVKWMTDRHMEFNETLQEVVGVDQGIGLSTVRKVLNVQPTRYYNGQSFFCEIKHPAFVKAEVQTLTLNVTYPPSPARISPTADKKGLICTSEGNPPPIFTWTMPSISLLPTMTGDIVDLISPQDPARNNDTYICVASNGILPDQTARMTTNEAVSVVAITSSQNVGAIVGGVIGGLLLLAIIGIVVYYFVLRPSRDKDTGPYQYTPTIYKEQASSRPTIEHANGSLNKNRPPSPVGPPPDERNEGSDISSSDSDEGNHDVDVEVNPATNLVDPDKDNAEIGGITSRASINFQPYWRHSVCEARRKRPSTSPAHRHSRAENHRKDESPVPVARQQVRYDTPPGDNFDQNDRYPMIHDEQFQGYGDDDYNEPYNQPKYVGFPQGGQPPRRMDSLPQHEPKYTEIDHSRYNPGPRRQQFEEPVEYAQIRHGYSHVV